VCGSPDSRARKGVVTGRRNRLRRA
jgi:hypothetical protein